MSASYKYTVVNSQGKRLQGVLTADNKNEAREELILQDYVVLELEETDDPVFRRQLFSFGVPAQELVFMTRQLSALLRAGVPILQAIKVCESQSQSHRLRIVLAEVQEDIRRGLSLSQALRKHSQVFDEVMLALIGAGEKGGALDQVLIRVSKMIQYELEVKKQIKSALRYPMVVLGFLVGAFFIILTYVMPRIIDLFASSNVELPWPTRACITMNTALHDYPLLIAIGLVVPVTALYLWIKTPAGKYFKDGLLLNIPYLGDLLLKGTLSRFAYIFSILSHSGVAMLTSMDILADVVQNMRIERALNLAKSRIEEGETMSVALQDSPYFNDLIISMISVGEQTGSLEEMMEEISSFYEEELKYSISKFTDVLPVFITVGMAIMVGFFVAAVFLPMFDMARLAGGMN